MKLKYYLRGLGIGIIVTALLLGTLGTSQKKTDTQVSVEETREASVLSELNAEDTVEESGAESRQETLEDAAEEEPEAAAETVMAQTEEEMETGNGEEDGQDQQSTREATEAVEDGDGAKPVEASAQEESLEEPQDPPQEAVVNTSRSIIVAIYPGEGSYTISRKLASLGLVESAEVYDEFLCQNGYDKRLVTGNYEISEGTTPEEIARILTAKK